MKGTVISSKALIFSCPDHFKVHHHLLFCCCYPINPLDSSSRKPPQPPPAPVCTCDSVGNVRIHWARSPSNDVMGYRIFRGNIASTEEMQQITPNWIRDTFYRTTVDMNTLSENTYYRVRATDYRENISVFSAPCTAARPDVIPPAPPVIASYKILGQNIEFLFTASNSQDVVKYRFLRRLKDYLD